MVEIFKTNVQHRSQANGIITLIQAQFTDYQATFDLEDCDCVLRISTVSEPVSAEHIIQIIAAFGFHAELLQDTYSLSELLS